MASGDLLNIGTGSLLAFQRALSTTGHNISNANTEGYSRQRVELSTRPPQYSTVGYIGSGVQVDAIRRMYDDFVNTQLLSNTSSHAQLNIFYELSAQVDNLLADTDSNLTASLQGFFNSLQGVADDPSSIPSREALLSEARTLADRFHFMDDRLTALQNNVNTEIRNTVTEINELATAIANLNRDIVHAQGSGNGVLPNDLLDERDLLIRKLSEKVSVKTVPQDDGALNVFIGNGQTLVIGHQARQLSAVQNNYDISRLEIGYTTGGTTSSISNQISGGELGGLLQYRTQSLDSAQNALGRIAIGLSQDFNAQHRLGMDLNGDLGLDFFTAIDQSAPQIFPSSNNTGTVSMGAIVTDASLLTTSNYRVNYDNVAGTVSLVRLSDNATVNSLATAAFTGGTALTGDGLSVSYTAGAFALTNDSFLLRPTANGAGDIGVRITDAAKIAVAGPLRTEATISNIGNGSISPPSVSAVNTSVLKLSANNGPITLTFANDNGTGVPGFIVTDGSGVIDTLDYNPATESNGKSFTLAAPYDGISFSVSKTPIAGDTFVINDNINGVSDNRNALSLASLQNASTLLGGATYQSAYGQLVAEVGTATRQAEVSAGAQQNLLNQVVAQRESVSGVNLDEEAANLVRYQQAYEASAQVIAVASSLFDTLIDTLRR